MIAAYKVTEPDRVPVILPSGPIPAYFAGSDLFSVMYDYPKLVEVWTKFHQEFEMDLFVSPASVLPWTKSMMLLITSFILIPAADFPGFQPGSNL